MRIIFLGDELEIKVDVEEDFTFLYDFSKFVERKNTLENYGLVVKIENLRKYMRIFVDSGIEIEFNLDDYREIPYVDKSSYYERI